MIERLVFSRGSWVPRHRYGLTCWCRPKVGEEDGCPVHVHHTLRLSVDSRERPFISGHIEAPV